MPLTRHNPTNLNLKLVVIASLLALAACTDGTGNTNAATNLAAAPGSSDDQASAACAACHQGALSLAGRDADEVAKLIEAIAAGERAHPPVKLPATDSASIAALAQALTAD